MRRTPVLVITVIGLLLSLVAPAQAGHDHWVSLDGPDPSLWLSDPDGEGVGIEQADPVEGSRGFAHVRRRGATIAVRATGLEPWHTYTLWIVYFSDSTLCVDGCNGPDLGVAGGGVVYGTGRVALPSGRAWFVTRLRDGAGADVVGAPPPPPFAIAPYEAGPHNEFHLVVRSHGPIIEGELREQLTTFDGGCTEEVGPAPEEVGYFPVPSEPGECGDVQLHIFK